MNAQEFIAAVKLTVERSAVNGVMSLLEKPPRRIPDHEFVELSNWFKGLPPNDQQNVRMVIQHASSHATYNFLAILDGLAAIEPIGPKGQLELFFRKNEHRVLLNDPDAEDLTNLYKGREVNKCNNVLWQSHM